MRSAVVLGGSFAGLLAARVLSEYADEVVLVEPDPLDEDGTGPGAPHRGQLHAFLGMGHAQLEKLFPGITRELTDGGAHLGQGDAIRFYVDGRLKVPVPGIRMLGATRPFIERHVRRRVTALGNVRVERATARGLLFGPRRVLGARIAAHGEPETELTADLVVDAMGRSSRLGSWLAGAGWQAAPVDRMRVDLGYATARFARGGELPGTVIAHSMPGPRSGYLPTVIEPGALAAVEGDTWSVLLAGYADHKPGKDPAEFLARLKRCVAPFREVAEVCEPLGDVEPFTFAESRRRRYGDLTRFPAGLVVIGDALATVNPVYGQGLTLATLQAASLHAHLRSGARGGEPALRYFRTAGVFVDAAWELSTTADLAQPHVTGPYPRGYPVLKRVADGITEASVTDPEVNETYMRVLHMLERPRALTGPRVLYRTARTLLGG
ncbi:hypothetical protein [Streptomyces sp. NPDC094049]|uniref:NAD(P)/FAD-dependent oxidoreductase n=1 Tax=Streptomyces sp. NPDC094049 TaxID=3154987 RepID=UPI00331AFD59